MHIPIPIKNSYFWHVSGLIPLPSLTAVSPLDGRYASITQKLVPYFSEYALMHSRSRVEIEYFIALCEYPLPELKSFPKEKYQTLRNIYEQWDTDCCIRIKTIEKKINHDVKAIEYYIKEEFDKAGLDKYKEFIHFALTSQDINNTAFPLLLKAYIENEFKPHINSLLDRMEAQCNAWKDVPMLARTHGQPASPTRVGKEIEVFVVRIKNQMALLNQLPHCAKFGGATGNFNAHHAAYPDITWNAFADQFVNKSLGLIRSCPTTQIEHYDHLAALLDNIKRINTILLDYSRDMWQYIALNYFTQHVKKGEVGSSAMPHKINPIDFENAEGNLGMANALFEHLSGKMPISRMQRDLTDSTVMRNIGTPFAHTCIALHALEKGIGKLTLNRKAIEKDLEDNWVVVAEAIQTILRKEGYARPYEMVKELTRQNKQITKEDIHTFISSLPVGEDVKKKLLGFTPFNYTGI